MYVSAYDKNQDVRWATFQLMYGQQSGTAYAVFSPLKSASEVDQEIVMGKQFEQSMGEDGMKKLGELVEVRGRRDGYRIQRICAVAYVRRRDRVWVRCTLAIAQGDV